MPYTPALDGLRAIAIVLVMLCHAQGPWFPGANVGVDIFLVLSGYLITRLLLAEWRQAGRLDLRHFYIQRLLRLSPPLLLMLAIYVGAGPWLWPDYYFHWRDVAVVLLYQADLATVFGMTPDKLQHAWSLGIEERYYLLWPLALAALLTLRKPARALTIALGAALLVMAWRGISLSTGSVDGDVAYYRFDMRISGLLLGSWLALYLEKPRRSPQVAGYWLAATAALTLVVVGWPWGNALRLSFGVPVAELATVGVLCWIHQRPNSRLVALLSLRPAVYIGQLSYGLYLFHYPAMAYVRTQHPWQVTLLAGSAFALIMAVLSFHLLEVPIRRWRKSLRPKAAPTPVAASD